MSVIPELKQTITARKRELKPLVEEYDKLVDADKRLGTVMDKPKKKSKKKGGKKW